MSPASLVLAILSHAVLSIPAFSLAIPGDPVSNVSFPVIWERNSTDPTVFSLGQQLEDSSTGQFSRGEIFANISGTQGQSVDPQAINLTVNASGTATSTFYISPTFAVLSPAQAASTTVNSAEIFLGTSFPLTLTSTTSVPSSPASASTNTGSTPIPEASPAAGSAGSATNDGHKTGVIAGGVVGGVVALSVLICCYHVHTDGIPKVPTH
ncbi:hypothetical protein BDP27DRAFT_1418642 [Rhodocollybia butyracea]|uniref:Uncharacterized protein n=1 Tax=Rhodocollybia butyracea TaxID=206335 RepID=A0A9P5UAB1_9AGAR|nr:hypothetical protein BDP27DRAFT_1418642 [Rhodocollybia butyracea]